MTAPSAPQPTLAAFARTGCASPPPSLSLGSFGDATRLVKSKLLVSALSALCTLPGVAADTRSTDDPSRSTPTDAHYRTAWREFYFGGSSEGDIGTSLVRVGRPIVPSLCRAVSDPNMRRRRYAILSLGYIGDRRAIPTLERIYADRDEDSLYRGDALQSIYMIDRALGRLYARKQLARTDYLGSMAGYIRDGLTWLTEPPTD